MVGSSSSNGRKGHSLVFAGGLLALAAAAAVLTPAARGAGPAQTAIARCQSSHLAVSIGSGGGPGMSQDRVSLQLRNKGGSSCTLYGYPGVSWSTGPDGRRVGPGAAHYASAVPSALTLRPGAVASAPLDIVVGDGGLSTSECHPKRVAGLRVYPPGEMQPLFVAYHLGAPGACSVRTASPMLQIGFMQLGAHSNIEDGRSAGAVGARRT
jgi:Protein of unknown function (DUF4232)